MTKIAEDKLGELSENPDRAILSQGYVCTKCHTEHSPDQFGGWPRNKWCRGCQRDYQVDFRARHGGSYRGSGRNKAYQSQSDVYKKLHMLLKDRKFRKGGNATTEQLEALWCAQYGRCALSGQPMNLDSGEDVVSVDQIVAGLGYNIDNIQLLRWCVNRAKGAMPLTDFLEMCKSVSRCNDYPEREYSQAAGSA